MRKYSLIVLFLFAAVVLSGPVWCRAVTAGSPVTVRELEKYYKTEKAIVNRYNAYSLKAAEEGLPNIARLFKAFSKSEKVHELNAKKLLKDLGATVGDARVSMPDIQETQTNFAQAVEVEIGEIEKSYPEILEAIKGEGVRSAAKALNYHWLAEKQQLEILGEIRTNTGFTYFLLVEKIERTEVKYFICRVCGLLVVHNPPDFCPVCKSPRTVFFDVDAPGPDE